MVKTLTDNTEQLALANYVEQAYLDYAMYVILDRALPHIGDGLKPVQRRIIFAMTELKLDATAKHKKSARTIGDVLGKYHPHSDSACYEAMVLMAQPFSLRYPLIDGQGNFGSSDDPKSFAAMRYTEARLTKFADVLLNEINQGTINWIKNFDGSLEEPQILPAELPHILLNGTTGIAVGMATDIPPHNLKEIGAALLLLLEAPDSSLTEIVKLVPAPDYPTGAEIITSRDELTTIYATGNGSIRARATYVVEDGNIVITSLPHLASGAHILEQIATEIQEKKFNLIADLRDESDHDNPTRLIIIPKSNRIDKNALMLHLFSVTDLEKSFRVNLNIIGLDGKPKVKSLKNILLEWLQFRSITVTKRLQHRLQIILARLHLLAGFLIAYKHLDKIIHIIRTHDTPEQELMRQFKLSSEQTHAILELKLKALAKLEEQKIIIETETLQKEQVTIEALLNSKTKLKNLIKQEITALIKKFGDPRRSALVMRDAAKAIEIVTPIEPVTVVLSAKGWIRAGKGHDINVTELSFKAGDEYLTHVCGTSNEPIIIFDSHGNAYTLAAEELPSLRGFGEPVTTKITPPPNTSFTKLVIGAPDTQVLLCSNKGYAFYTTISNLITRNRKGKTVIKLNGTELLPPAKFTTSINALFWALFTKNKELLIIQGADIPMLAKGKGKKIILLNKTNTITATQPLLATEPLLLTNKRKEIQLSPKEWKKYLNTDLKPKKSIE